MTIRHYNHSTWLAHRAIQARQLAKTYRPPTHIALPGALSAIPADRLAAYQDTGLTQHDITGRVNAQWREQNADVLHAHTRWAHGPYTAAIEHMRRLEAEQAAEALRRQAIFEQKMADWKGEQDA